MNEVLLKPFDVETHKKTFINYLEVIIDEQGVVHYAVPSHQEFLINYACSQLGISREELNKQCPPEYYFNFLHWLCQITKCIAVWDTMIIGKPNRNQLVTMNKLRAEGLYKGENNG